MIGAISLVAMSTRGRGSFVRVTLLSILAMFALLLVLNSLLSSKQELKQQNVEHKVEQAVRVKIVPSIELKAPTPPPVQPITEPVDEELVRQLEYELPEVDYGFWYRYAKPYNYRMDKKCAQYPDPLELQLHNIYWQTFINANVTFRLYAAYLDKRTGVPSSQGVVRILATANQIGDDFPPTHCQLWYAGHKVPIMSQISEYLSVWVKAWGRKPFLSYPHLLSCIVPDALPPNIESLTPRTVSLVSEPCDSASNSLRVHYDLPVTTTPSSSNVTSNAESKPPLSFGVCVKGFDFPYMDMSERLIEWFELQRLLGASRIYAYMYDVHPAVQRVLDYYQRIGFLELRPLTMANGMPRLRHYQHLLLQNRRMVKRLNELIPYNDCFYRNMYRHDYLLNVDVDEVIMPLGALRTWQDILHTDELLTKITCPNGFVSLCFINSYFTKVVPEAQNHEQMEGNELYVLQHTMRHQNYSSPNKATKCFHNTRYSLTLHNHFTLKWLPGGCRPRSIGLHLAHMQHYRELDTKYELSELVEDRTAWKYATELRAAVEYVWMHLDDVQSQIADAEEHNMSDELLDHETDLEQAQEQQQVMQQAQFVKVY